MVDVKGIAVAALLVTLPMALANAQDYPAKPIEVVIPSSPGGGSDIVARLLQQAVGSSLGEPFVISYLPGGGTGPGNRKVATSPPDGYTALMMHQAVLTSSAQGIFDLGWTSLTPVALTGNETYVAAALTSSPYTSLAELYEAAKTGRVTTGVSIGGMNHIVSVLAGKAGNVEFAPVQYAGGADARTALLGGHIDVLFGIPGDVIPYVQSNDVRVLGVLGDERLEAFPGVPTAKEQGFDVTAGISHMWWMPAGTPVERSGKFAAALELGMQSEAVKTEFANRAIAPLFMSGQALIDRVTAEAERIETVVKDLGLQ